PSSSFSGCFEPRCGADAVGTADEAGAMAGRGSRRSTMSCTGRSRAATSPPRPAPSIASMKTVLVVDDEPKIVQLARDYLEHAGFGVVTAGDGRSALAAIRTRRPDLVVLDLALPELDGLDVTRAIRSDSNLPIVMLTARDDELDKLLGLELGAD